MSLITTIEEIQPFLPVDADLEITAFLPYVKQAQRNEISQLLGKELLDLIQEAYEQNEGDLSSESQELQDLLPMVQNPLAFYAYARFANKSNISLSHMGMFEQAPDHTNSAPKWKVQAAIMDIISQGDEAAEQLLEFLEENASDYPLWKDSTAMNYADGSIFAKASDFNSFIEISYSRRLFLRLKPYIRKAELLAKKVVSAELFADIQNQLKTQTMEPETEELLPYLRNYVAHEAMLRALPFLPFSNGQSGLQIITTIEQLNVKSAISASDKRELMNELKSQLQEAKNELIYFLQENADEYPLWKNSPANGNRVPKAPLRRFKNSGNKGYVGF